MTDSLAQAAREVQAIHEKFTVGQSGGWQEIAETFDAISKHCYGEIDAEQYETAREMVKSIKSLAQAHAA